MLVFIFTFIFSNCKFNANNANMEDYEPDMNLFNGNRNYQKMDMPGSQTIWLDEFGKVYILNKYNPATDTTYLKCRQHTARRGTFIRLF